MSRINIEEIRKISLKSLEIEDSNENKNYFATGIRSNCGCPFIFIDTQKGMMFDEEIFL